MLVDVVIDGVEVPEDGTDAVDDVARLLIRTAQGDQQAFARLYDMLSSRVFGLILRVLVDRAQSEEVLQEVFLEVWQSADRFAPNKGQGRTWMLDDRPSTSRRPRAVGAVEHRSGLAHRRS